MFSRNLTAPEALRRYADIRKSGKRIVADYLRMARLYFSADRTFFARCAINMAQTRITLLEFLLDHVELLPTDAATIEVLRNDLVDMKNAVATANKYMANPSASFPK